MHGKSADKMMVKEWLHSVSFRVFFFLVFLVIFNGQSGIIVHRVYRLYKPVKFPCVQPGNLSE